ncbi:MAG: hypothetical protein BGP25_05000 [Lysobacterales bacterium 63-13]|nr:MAG: hypothetical protein BGP25_05000 [Xanthomonadales bacterium 63-13]
MAWRWSNPDNGRWFEARIERDLFGELVLATRWGGRQRAGMRVRCYPIRSRAELRATLHRVGRRRSRHGYEGQTRNKHGGGQFDAA